MGKTVSCGCYNDEKRYKHGLSDKRLYKIYKGMIDRCYNTEHTSYDNYGGRGITVCNDWLGGNGLKEFYEWAINNGYEDGLTIDRIDVNDMYRPSNCRWATDLEQANNKRNNRLITIDGITKTVTEWAAEYNMSPMTIRSRLRAQWDNEKLLEPPHSKVIKKSGVKGIYWSKVSQKWTMYIYDNSKKRIYVGLYNALEDAINEQKIYQNSI